MKPACSCGVTRLNNKLGQSTVWRPETDPALLHKEHVVGSRPVNLDAAAVEQKRQRRYARCIAQKDLMGQRQL
jgi:hypothetical protein